LKKQVLPPWSSPYHWRSQHLSQDRVPWSQFFDIESLKKFVSVVELSSLMHEDTTLTLDKILILEHFEFQENSLWEEKLEDVDCKEKDIYFW
jgi:peptide-O-fucosyltransferase